MARTDRPDIVRLNDLPGWHELSSVDQKQLQKLVIRADTDFVDGMTAAELEAFLASGPRLSQTARRFIATATREAEGVAPNVVAGLQSPSSSSGAADLPLTIAFDGSRNFKMWVNTTEFAREISEKYGKRLPITYFINTAYFDPAVKGSGIGKAGSQSEARTRWALAQKALNEGHEIANHTVRHRNGAEWTERQWQNELQEFHQLVQENLFQPVFDDNGDPVFPRWRRVDLDPKAKRPKDVVRIGDNWCKPDFPIVYKGEVLFDDRGKPNIEHPDLVPYRTVGFRAPELGHNAALYRVLERMGYLYDTSKYKVVRNRSRPDGARVAQDGRRKPYERVRHDQHSFDVWIFPLVKYQGMSTLPMDYNYWQANVSGSKMAADYKRAIVTAASRGEPWNIGHHFSLWRDGEYWQAMQEAIEFAAQGCPNAAGTPQCDIEFRSFGQVADDMGDPRQHDPAETASPSEPNS